jgi:hypothetical protein
MQTPVDVCGFVETLGSPCQARADRIVLLVVTPSAVVFSVVTHNSAGNLPASVPTEFCMHITVLPVTQAQQISSAKCW